MQNLVKRTQKLLFLRNVSKFIPVVSQIHCAPTVWLCNNQRYNFCMENNSSAFDRVSSYENLISRISSSQSINEVLKVYSSNEQLLKNEHVVLCLRMMARLLKATNQQEVEQLQNDDRYIKLTERAVNAIDTINEYEALDFLFWMRKFRVAKIDLKMDNQARDKFYDKLSEFLKQKSFNFRNLVNLYYDYSFINRNSQDICFEILNELRSDKKLLSPFTVIQILQAASRKTSSKQTQELILADYVTKNFHTLLDEFDTDQKCVIFKYLSLLQMNYNPPKFKLPSLLFTLRTHLKDKLDQLSEASVINILTAYQNLPKEFPTDLIDEIKEMVIITIQHNSQNIKSFFLLDFIESIQKIKRRRLDENQATVLASEIHSRLLHDEYLQKPKNIERLVKIYDNGLKHPSLQQALEELAKQNTQNSQKNFMPILYEFLVRRKADYEGSLDSVLTSNDISRLGAYSQVRLYLTLHFTQNLEKYQQYIDQLQPFIDQMVEQDFGKVVNILQQCTIMGHERKNIMDKLISKLQNQFEDISTITFQQQQNLFKNMFLSIELKEQKVSWMKWFDANADKMDMSLTTRVMDVFFQQENFTLDNFVVFLHVLELNKGANVALKKLFFILKDNQNFVHSLIKYELLFKRFLQNLTNWSSQQPDSIRLQYIYGFATIVQNTGFKNNQLTKFLKKSFEIYMEHQKQELNKQMEFMFSMMLLELNALQVKYARTIYEKNLSTIGDIVLKARYFSYILHFSNAEFRDSHEEETKEHLRLLTENFSTSNQVKVLNSLAVFLSFPSKHIAENKDLLLKTTKDFIMQGNDNLYKKLIFSLSPRYVNNHYGLYFPFLKEIINAYPQYRRRLMAGDIVEILQKFVSLNCKYPSIYNHILEDIGSHFNYLKPDQRIQTMISFSQLQIKQTDFFQKNLEKIGENPQQFRGHLHQLLNSLFKIGFDAQQSVPTILNIVNHIKRSGNIEEAYCFLKYLPVLDLENEAEIVDEWFQVLPSEVCKDAYKFAHRGEISLISEYYAAKYPSKPEYAEKIRNLLGVTAEEFKEIRASQFTPERNMAENNVLLVSQYLDAMKVEHEKFQEFNGMNIDILIPSQKILLSVVQARNINFDRSTLTGRSQVQKRIIQMLDASQKVIMLNNLELRSNNDNIGRVNLLISEGIESGVKDGEYDFNKIDRSLLKKRSEQTDESSLSQTDAENEDGNESDLKEHENIDQHDGFENQGKQQK